MQLEKIDILNFKNIPEAKLDFSPRVNCLLGLNGMGKSNLLEAIHFASLLRGFRSLSDNEYIRHGAEIAIVRADYLRDGGERDSLSAGLAAGKRKQLKCNGKSYPRLSDHIGRFPIVAITPQDSRLIQGSGEERRRLADMVISQPDPIYMAAVADCRKALDARNRMLRSGMSDPILFESVERPLCAASRTIHARRKEWAEKIVPGFSSRYSSITGGSEMASLRYVSPLDNADPQEILDKNRQRDAILGHTSSGIHRDDFEMLIDGYSVRQLGSQGQEKSFGIALRLAVFDYLREATSLTPLLLLDDLFDKLDASRVSRIIEMVVSDPSFGQIFVTDTDRTHLHEILPSGSSGLLLQADSGHFSPEKL